MNVVKNTITGGLLAAFLLVGMSAFAANANKGSFQLQHPTNVAGKQLATGSYTVQWDGSGDQVSVKIYQGKKEMASTSAQVVKIDRPASYDQTITSSGDNGSSTLSEIRFRGKTFALRLSGEGGMSSSSGSAQ